MYISYLLIDGSAFAEHITLAYLFQKRTEGIICGERRDETVGRDAKDK
jgi:hypothetical protein